MVQIILASSSPSRLKLLEGAGIKPTVLVSGIDEESEEFNSLSPTELVLITPAPAISNEQAIEIQLSTINLANEIQLIGGLELIVDADDFKKLIGINWINPLSSHSFSIGSVTGYFEQYLRAVLDLPLGNSTNLNSFIVTGNLFTDINSDDYRPYLHLMARNPNLKFDQLRNKVGLLGDNLENMLTEVIHAQQYYCGEIDE